MVGIYNAIISPMDKNGIFNDILFINILNQCLLSKITGLFVCGNTGNGFNLDIKKKIEIFRCAAENRKSLKLIAHIGSSNPDNIFEALNAVEKLKFDAVALMPPLDMLEFQEIKKLYIKISDFSHLPVMAYYMPSLGGYKFSPDEISEILTLPNIFGLKYTSSDITKMKQIKNKTLKPIFWGRDDLLLNGLEAGACGAIGGFYNVLPSFFVSIYNNMYSDFRIARKYQKKICKSIKILRSIYPNILGSEFVIRSLLEQKKCMSDEEFYNFLERKEDFYD